MDDLEPFRSWDELARHLDRGLLIHGPDGRTVHANEIAAGMLGVSVDRLVGGSATAPAWNPLDETGAPLSGERLPSSEALRTGRRVRALVGARLEGAGEPRWLEVDAVPRPSASGAISHVVVHFSEVTARKEAEDRSGAIAQLLSAFHRSADESAYALAAAEILRRAAGTAEVEIRLGEEVQPDALPVPHGGRVLGYLVARPVPGGCVRRAFLEAMAPLIGAGLDHLRVEAEVRRAREAERSLAAIQQLAAGAESLDDLVAGVTRVLETSTWVAPNLGASVVLLGPAAELARPAFHCPSRRRGDRPPCFPPGETRSEERVHDLERRRCPSGRLRCRVPIRALEGRVEGTIHVCLAADVVAGDAIRFLEAVALVLAKSVRRRRAEDALRTAQKLEILGRLAGGIAHDFRNLLTVILSTGELLREELPEGDSRRDDVTDILDAANRGAGLVRQLLAFGRSEPRLKLLRPAREIAELERLVRRTIGPDVRLVLTAAPDAGAVLIDAGHLEQVVMNLVVNARDAMPEGGNLRIDVTGDRLEDRDLPCVRITVADSGPGIPAHVLPRIFEPFFSTKLDRGGTGLGLATVDELVRRAGGRVTVRSEPGRGARFDVWLPVAGEAAATAVA